MVVQAVAPVLVPITSLFLSVIFDAVADAQWCVAALPAIVPSDVNLAAPKPDISIGCKHAGMGGILTL